MITSKYETKGAGKMKTKRILSLTVSLVLAMGGAAMLPEDAAPAGGVISVSANDIVTDDFVF